MTDQRCPICLGTGIASDADDIVPSMHIPEPPKCRVCNGTGQLSDAALLAAYQRTSGEPGDVEADALCREIEARGLDT